MVMNGSIVHILRNQRSFFPAITTLFLVLLHLPGDIHAARITEVTIQGIEGSLYENVTGRLEIFRNRRNTDLSLSQIRRMHKRAPQEIRLALQPFGYYSPIVNSSLVENPAGIEARYIIAPGEPIQVASVTILEQSGSSSPLDQVLANDSFPLQVGDIVDHRKYASGKQKLLQALYDRGYVGARFTRSEIQVSLERNTADIVLEMGVGSLYYFGKATFEQNVLDENVLQRYVNFNEGDVFSQKKLVEFQQILYATNYFGRVIITADIDSAEGGRVPVAVKLADPEFFSRYSFGLGYATDDGIRASLGWENRLANRYGHSFSADVVFAEREAGLEFVYGIPVRDPRFDTVLFGATYSDENWRDTESQYFRTGVSFEHAERREKYNVGIELRNETFEVGDAGGESFLPIVLVGWETAYGDDLINTRHGVSLAITIRAASESLFADTSFLQGLLSGKLITSPVTGLRILCRGSVGALSVESFADLPPTLRFYAGGDHSVRGFAYNELATKDDAGNVIGGKYLLFGSVEVEKTVTDSWSMALFYDVGKGIMEFNEDLGQGAGGGVRYRLPFGQIRLDVASALSKEGNPWRFHFTVGGDL